MMTTLVIPCSPVAQPRQRHRVVCGHAMNYTPINDPVNTFKATCQMTWRQFVGDVPPADYPLYVSIDFVLPKPPSLERKKDSGHRIWAVGRKDIDNLTKAVMDALAGLAWKNDNLIVMLKATKTYAADCEQPKVELTVLPAEPIGEAK